jgi:hypothetical protein
MDDMDDPNKSSHETKSVTKSCSAKRKNKKRALTVNNVKNKRQRRQGNITDLLEISESDDEGNYEFRN